MGYEKLLVNGTDLASVTSCQMDLSGLWKGAVVRGDNIFVPGVDGVTQTAKQFDSNIVDIPVMLNGTTTTTMNDALRTFRLLLKPGVPLALERQMSFTAGNEQHTATGELANDISPAVSLLRFGRFTISLRIIDGLWHKKTSVAASVTTSGSIVSAGDVRTRRMVITMAAGTLTSTTTGHTLVYSGPGSADIDVEAMTAVSGATNVSSYVTWTKAYPMELQPGTNNFTGTASFVYYPAYQ